METGRTPALAAVYRTGVPLLAVVAVLVLGAAGVHAEHLATVKLIDAGELKAWIDGGKKIALIDSRVPAEYKEGHLPTAINLPAPVMDQQRGKLPRDLSTPVVFYCNGWPECKKSHDACSQAVRWGYQQVYWFRDGLPAWQAKGYPIE